MITALPHSSPGHPMPDPRSPWPGLQRRYGRSLSRRRLVQAALRAEAPGGAALLEATDVIRAATKWGAAELAVAADLLRLAAAQAADPDGRVAALIAEAERHARRSADLLAPHEAARRQARLLELLTEARDAMAERLLEAYRRA